MSSLGVKAQAKKQNTFVLRIPNTEEGRAFRKQMKSYLNNSSYALDYKATGPRQVGNAGRKNINTAMKDASSVRVYIISKASGKQIDLNS